MSDLVICKVKRTITCLRDKTSHYYIQNNNCWDTFLLHYTQSRVRGILTEFWILQPKYSKMVTRRADLDRRTVDSLYVRLLHSRMSIKGCINWVLFCAIMIKRQICRSKAPLFPVQKFLYFIYWRYDNIAQLGCYILQIWHNCNVHQ